MEWLGCTQLGTKYVPIGEAQIGIKARFIYCIYHGANIKHHDYVY